MLKYLNSDFCFSPGKQTCVKFLTKIALFLKTKFAITVILKKRLCYINSSVLQFLKSNQDTI